MKATTLNVWGGLKQFEGLMVALLAGWSVVADLLSQIGTPVRVVTAAAAALALLALIVQDIITASDTSGGLPAFLMAIVGAWAIISSNLGDLGVPVKVVTVAGAGLALVAFVLQQGVAINVVSK